MVQTLNFINLSSQQAPNDVDWAGLVNSGVQGVLIRLGHGIIRDPCASGHIAKAKQYGLYWHGYHTYEGVVNEPQFTIKNANELGLSTSQYYFVDLTKSSDPFNDYYALHANWLSQGYSTGLLISSNDYLSKFTDSDVTASGTLRWLISDTEPANYDIWQYSSEGTIGTSSVKVGFNFAKTDKLKYNLNTTLTGADISKDPYNPQAPVGGAYIGWGYDTTGLGGGKTIGYSTNGKNFYALIGPDGLVVRKSDGNRIYGTIADQIDSAISANVIPAESAANSAYSMASQAVEQANVTKQAQAATDQAITEAKQGANDAMSRAMSAWDVATGAKEAVTDFDPLIKSAQSDASKALAQIADTANALSDAKTAFGSGVAEAKELAIAAQTTANSAVESAGENAKELASQANALSDAKKAIDSDVASAKGLANVAQATADNAIKSASSVANDLSVVASQAKANANGITKVTSDVGLLQTTVANNTGDISTIQETAKQIQQSVSDNAGNITVAKQTADSAVAVASDAKSNATVAVQTASGASVTAKNAQGDATTAMTTANSAVIQASDANSNATVAVQTASEASLTAANAKGDASIAKQTASYASVQIKNAQGDISKLQTRAGAIETSVANNSGAIADVQATANQLKASVSDNAGNITIAKQTADSAVTVASDAKSNATVASQTASQASITAQNASGQAASAVLTANGAMTTASDAQSDATVAIQTASGASLTATNAQGDASIAKQTASEAKVQASNAESDFAQLSVRANKIETNVANNSGAIASVQQTANGLTTTVGNVDNRVKTIEDKTNWTTKTGPLDMNTLTTTQNIYYRDSNLKNADGETGWAYIQVVSMGERVTQTVWHDRSSIQHTRTGAVSGSNYNWDAWNTVATNAQVVQVKQTVDGITTTINDPKTGLNATYQTAAGNATTISNVKSDVYQLQTTANGLTSRVGNLESKTNTQETAIEQNKNAIALKADQTNVDTLKGNVTDLQAKITTQANEIENKVTRSDVTGMLTGYATQDYTQSLVTQKADDWNLNLTSLKTDVNAIKTTGGGVNLLQGTDTVSGDVAGGNGTFVQGAFNGYDAVKTNGCWSEQYLNLKLALGRTNAKAGDWVTISVYVKADKQIDTGSLDVYRALGNVDANTNDGHLDPILMPNKPITTQWQQYAWSFQINYISLQRQNTRVEYNNDTSDNWIYWSGWMLEKGTVAHDWSPAPSDMATVTSVTNLSATVDGIQAQVYNSDGSSRITQLSNLIATKVSSDDFNSLSQSVNLQTLDSADINNMKTNGHYFVHNLANNPIGGWVYVDVTGNGNDRIRQDVYQDSGSGHKYRRLFGTSWTSWEEGATESQITQLSDDINLRVKSADLISQINLQAGTALIQSNKLVLDAGTTVITGEAFIPSAAISSISADKIMLGSSALWNTDGTLNLVNQNGNLKALIQVKQGLVQDTTQSIISFSSDYNNRAFSVTPVGATITPTLFFERYDQTQGHWLGFTRNEIRRDGLMFHTWDDEGERFFVGCHARFDRNISADGTINQGTWNGTNGKPLAGILTIATGNTIWSGSDFLAIGDHLSNSFTNVMARSFSQQSTLSSKTNIEAVDPKDALDLVNRTDIKSYQYKTDVAQGKTKRYTSLIIDDVNDVSQYYAPNEFTNEERTGRDDGSAVGFLFLAVKELTRRIKNLEEKLNG
ncbi:tail fiber domain-containing protein [Limosilactobacillus fermentum]